MLGLHLSLTYININKKITHMNLQEAIKKLKDYGANIEQLELNHFWVEDNGIWGLLEHEAKGFYLDQDELIKLAEQYCEA